MRLPCIGEAASADSSYQPIGSFEPTGFSRWWVSLVSLCPNDPPMISPCYETKYSNNPCSVVFAFMLVKHHKRRFSMKRAILVMTAASLSWFFAAGGQQITLPSSHEPTLKSAQLADLTCTE